MSDNSGCQKIKIKRKYFALYNKIGKFWIVVPYDLNKLSLSRLKDKALLCTEKWTHFVTLTYADRRVTHFREYDVAPTYKIDDGMYNIKVDGRIRTGCLVTYKDNLKDINYKVKGNTIKVFINRIKNYFRKHSIPVTAIRYAWKYEEGSKTFRPHFHMIISTEMCTPCLYWLLKYYWNAGNIHVNPMYDDTHLLHYMHKEFTKNSTFHAFVGRKRWGFCKGLNYFSKNKDEYEYRKPIWSAKDAWIINELNKSRIDKYYSVDFTDKVQQQIKNKFDITRLL